MFVNCPYCGFLVALDDTGQPLARCPNCAQRLREDSPAAVAPEPEHAGQPEAPVETPTASTVAPEAPPATDSAHGDATDVHLQEHTRQEEVSAAQDTAIPAAPTESIGETQMADEVAPQDETQASPPPVADGVDASVSIAATNSFAPDILDSVVATAPDQTPVAEAETTGETEAASQQPDPHPHEDDDLRIDREDRAGATTTAQAMPADAATAPITEVEVEVEPAPVAPAQSEAVQAPPATPAPPSSPAAPDAPSAESGPLDAPPLALPAPDAVTQAPSPTDAENAHARTDESVDASAPSNAPTAQPAQAAEAEAAPAQPASSIPVETASVAPAAARVRKSPPAPSFARSKPQAAPVDRRRLALHWGAIAALSLLLALQLLLSDRARLAGDPRWRPLLAPLCAMLQCTLPPWREPQAFRVVERDVRARQPGVLRVSARIRNDARWPQPWPALQLTLSDANGREVATRVFAPREYLGGAPSQSQLGSGQSAALAMDIVEPGPQAVAFTFDFK